MSGEREIEKKKRKERKGQKDVPDELHCTTMLLRLSLKTNHIPREALIDEGHEQKCRITREGRKKDREKQEERMLESQIEIDIAYECFLM